MRRLAAPRAPWRRRAPRFALPELLEAFARAHPHAEFVEVGANDGWLHDPLRGHIRTRGWTGVMVEPVPHIFAKLQANYGGSAGIRLVNVAVSGRAGRLPFYHLRDPAPGEREALPFWYDGVGSFSRETVLSHAAELPDIAERLVELEVPVVTFEALCEEHGVTGPDLLMVDTEGHDWEVLQAVDFARRHPRLIVYEHYHLSPADRAACRAHLEGLGYELLEEGFDTMGLLPQDDRLTRRFRRLRPAAPGLSKAEERR